MGRVAKYKKVSSADKQHSKNPLQFSMGFGFAGSDEARRERLAEHRIRKRDRQISIGKISRKKQLTKADLLGGSDDFTGNAGSTQKKNRADDEEAKFIKSLNEFERSKLEQNKPPKKSQKLKSINDSEDDDGIRLERIMDTQKEFQSDVIAAMRLFKVRRLDGNQKIVQGSKGVDRGKPQFSLVGRQEGESFRDFERRLEKDKRKLLKTRNELNINSGGTHNVAAKEYNTARHDRKKQFLSSKRANKGKKRVLSGDESDSNEVDHEMQPTQGEDKLVTGDQVSGEITRRNRVGGTVVQNWDQVERPPEFKKLPRGAKLMQAAPSGGDQRGSEQEMQDYMAKIQHQYAKVKQQRRNRGDGFHL